MSELLENTLLELEKTRSDFWNLDRYCANFLNILIKTKNAKNNFFLVFAVHRRNLLSSCL